MHSERENPTGFWAVDEIDQVIHRGPFSEMQVAIRGRFSQYLLVWT